MDASPNHEFRRPLAPRRKLCPWTSPAVRILRCRRGPVRRVQFEGKILRLGRALASPRTAARLLLAHLQFEGPPLGLGRRKRVHSAARRCG